MQGLNHGERGLQFCHHRHPRCCGLQGDKPPQCIAHIEMSRHLSGSPRKGDKACRWNASPLALFAGRCKFPTTMHNASKHRRGMSQLEFTSPALTMQSFINVIDAVLIPPPDAKAASLPVNAGSIMAYLGAPTPSDMAPATEATAPAGSGLTATPIGATAGR